jgi:flagellar hook protein FlgE
MGLASALSTALTGLSAAETTIDVVGNNLANSSTVGFKASRVEFATQFLQTQSLGSAPGVGASNLSGGTNPRQIGLGVQVASIAPDFTQGTVQISSNPSDLAIQGDGFFIVQASSGERLYTRNGAFKTNSNNELVTTTGNKLLGYGVDDNFSIQTTTLGSIQIPLGSTSVAQATQNVFFQGTLTPTGDIADTAEILNSAILSDGKYDSPDNSSTVTGSAAPDVSATTLTPGGGAGSLTGTYSYKVVFVDASGKESPADTTSVTAAGDAQIGFTGIPTSGTTDYVGRRIYRSVADATDNYYLVGDINDNTTTTFNDTTTDAALTALPKFDDTQLTGNYTYRITWSGASSTIPESRPSGPLGPTNVTNGRLLLSDFPPPTDEYAGGTINIYRNVPGQSDTFFLVASNVDPSSSYTDSSADTKITSTDPLVNPDYKTLDLDGPKIDTNTALVDVVSRSGNTYSHIFAAGTLSFDGTKGGNDLGTRTLEIRGSSDPNPTTVQDLIDFMTDALGIQTPSSDSLSPIPNDKSGQSPGGAVLTNGRIQLIGNNGVDSAISIPLSAFKLTPTGGGAVTAPNLGFGSVQSAKGQSVAADFKVYDSLGIPLNVRVTTVLESRDSTTTTYRWFADSTDNDPTSGAKISVGTGQIKFDGEGNVIDVTNSTVAIERSHVSSVKPLQFNLDFTNLSGLAANSSTLAAARQDGSGPGSLSSFIIGEDGVISGVFSNGITRTLGQIVLARFSNPEGLQALGSNNYSAGVNSGLPVIGAPGSAGIGGITAGALELSNTDVGKNLINLILASTAYRGNTRVITTVDQMLQELLSLNR